MSARDILIFAGVLVGTIIFHSLVFHFPDEAEVTQFTVVAAMVAIIGAIRRQAA